MERGEKENSQIWELGSRADGSTTDPQQTTSPEYQGCHVKDSKQSSGPAAIFMKLFPSIGYCSGRVFPRCSSAEIVKSLRKSGRLIVLSVHVLLAEENRGGYFPGISVGIWEGMRLTWDLFLASLLTSSFLLLMCVPTEIPSAGIWQSRGPSAESSCCQYQALDPQSWEYTLFTL